jgi:hypothetical protein
MLETVFQERHEYMQMKIQVRGERSKIAHGSFLLALTFSFAGCSVTDQEFRETKQALEPGEQCLISDHAIEHTCTHVTYGPFASVVAAPYPGSVLSTINTPHTAFTVALPSVGASYLGQVIYQPPTTGAFAFFLAPDLELELYTALGEPVAPVGEQAVGSVCAGLQTGIVYQLDETETYSVVAGPTTNSSYLAIVEYLGSEPSCEACEHIDLEASLSRHPRARQNASVHLAHEVTFEIPESIPLSSGSSVGARATFKFGNGEQLSRCRYVGGASHPETLTLESCNHGYEAESDAEADTFELKVDTVGPCGSITLELEIEPEAC